MIETERLIIRPIENEDIKDISEYGCDEETGLYMLYWPKTYQQIKDFINECVSSMKSENPEWYEYVIQLKENSKVIGNISLINKNKETEMGWISNKKYWNNGYMTEAVKVMIEYAFCILGVCRIIATCTDKNIASYKVMEKCNMNREQIERDRISMRNGMRVIYNKLTYCIEREEN